MLPTEGPVGVLALTAAMEGFFPSPAGGWVTSAPRKITGCWNTGGLRRERGVRSKACGCHLGLGYHNRLEGFCMYIFEYSLSVNDTHRKPYKQNDTRSKTCLR